MQNTHFGYRGHSFFLEMCIKFIIVNAKFIILNTKFIISLQIATRTVCDWQPSVYLQAGNKCIE